MGYAGGSALLLVVAGVILGAGGLTVVGVLMGLVAVLRSAWSRYGLRALGYERRVSARRIAWGERIELDLVVRNAKLLPVPRLRVDDLVTHGADIVGRRLAPSAQRGLDVLRETWSVSWFERVTRHLEIVGSHRGTYRFESVDLRVDDLFGQATASETRSLVTAYRVVPRCVAVRSSDAASPTAGASRAQRGLYEDPALFAGVRPYQAGDQVRRIHWKASARLGRPVSRRFDPAREREVVLAIDIQTLAGPSWVLAWDEDLVESLCVAALSLARGAVGAGIGVGVAANTYSGRAEPTLYLPPSAAPTQIAAVADALADVSPYVSLPFDRLVAGLARRAPVGYSVIALSARDPAEFASVLRRLGAQGYRVSHAALGPDAARWTARARAAGLSSAGYRLHPDWQTADALERVA